MDSEVLSRRILPSHLEDDSRTLAQRLAEAFDTDVPKVAYEVRLMSDGRSLEWIERTASGEIG